MILRKLFQSQRTLSTLSLSSYYSAIITSNIITFVSYSFPSSPLCVASTSPTCQEVPGLSRRPHMLLCLTPSVHHCIVPRYNAMYTAWTLPRLSMWTHPYISLSCGNMCKKRSSDLKIFLA